MTNKHRKVWKMVSRKLVSGKQTRMASLFLCMACTQIQDKREGKERKKSFPVKLHQTTICVSSREEEDTKNLTMQWKHQYNYRSQPHTQPEVGRVADVLVGALHALTTFLFFNYTKPKMPLRPINNHKQTMRKLLQSP